MPQSNGPVHFTNGKSGRKGARVEMPFPPEEERDHLDGHSELSTGSIPRMQLEAHPSAFPNSEFEQLMARYQQADPSAVTALVERLSPQLYRFFASQLGNRADAEDMLQDAWLRIHRVRHTYRAGDPVLPWVYTIARRVRVDNYRKRIRMSSRETSVDVLPEVPTRN